MRECLAMHFTWEFFQVYYVLKVIHPLFKVIKCCNGGRSSGGSLNGLGLCDGWWGLALLVGEVEEGSVHGVISIQGV